MSAARGLVPVEGEVPIAPSAEAWRAMSAEARDRFVEGACLALEREAALMPEGFPHFYNKNRAYNLLRDHFDRGGRSIFLACELPVLYPGAPVFAPDLIAVVDVEPEGAAERRMCWSVAVEQRGVDLALEIVMAGDRVKDLDLNVRRFAQLGITEYFVYDRLRQRLHGFRLLDGAYRSIRPRGTALWSGVLGLELDVVDGALAFLFHGALLVGAAELLGRMERIAEQLNSRAGEAEDRFEQAQAEAQAARTQAALLQAEVEAALARDAQLRAEIEAERAARLALEAQIASLLAERAANPRG